MSPRGRRPPSSARLASARPFWRISPRWRVRRAIRTPTVTYVRGFALKFYTEQGNYDLVGNDTPVFFVRDPMKFPDFIHSQQRMPDTRLRSNNMQWDFWTLSPSRPTR